ncbi:MAG: hypothetical protein P9X22_04795 [Candidatus Zapsychrus exili]|nr:hypothetical protein [Candidatus Zapsychrus exili]
MKSKYLAFILGFTSIIAQIVLMRELITSFYGNETSYAVVLSSWLFWISIGGFVFSIFAKKIKDPLKYITVFQINVFFLLPSTIFLARCIKQIMGFQLGEIIGIIPISIGAFLLLAPLTFIFGGLFVLICKLYSEDENFSGVSGVYMWESLGAVAGGIIFSFVLIHFVPSMYLAVILGIINLCVILLILKKSRTMFVAVFVLAVVLLSFMGKADRYSRKIQFKGTNVVRIEDSVYGNIALTQRDGEYSLYENGLLSFTTGDELTAEQSVHYSMLQNPYARNVLLVGGGLSGSTDEILKYKQANIDYVELDKAIIDISRKYLPEKNLKSLDNKRVNIIYSDARRFIKRSEDKYDVIIINLSDPYTALINRYYTVEFFREASRALKEEGIITLSVSSSENYLNKEAKEFLQSINSTLREVFVDVKSVPGDTNIFLGCKRRAILDLNPEELMRRLEVLKIETKYVSENYLPFVLSEDRVSYINRSLGVKGAINKDSKPIAYLYDIVLFSTHFNSGFRNFIERIKYISLKDLLLFPALLLGIGLILIRRRPRAPITLSIFTTGFSEIIFQIIVILSFQALYGYAYYKIGLIISFFMIGLVLGSFRANKILDNKISKVEALRIYKMIQVGICLYPLLLAWLFVVFRDVEFIQNFPHIFATVFSSLPIIAGFIGGMQYPLAVYLGTDLEISSNVVCSRYSNTRSAGTLYAFDMLGAAMGAIVTATCLIPILGISSIAIFCFLINFVILILLFRSSL